MIANEPDCILFTELETKGLPLTISRPKRWSAVLDNTLIVLDECTKVQAGPHPTRNDRPNVRPASAIRLCLPAVTDRERGTSAGWVLIPAAFKTVSDGLPTALGSKMG